ncbi:CRISPR-associated helicase Cas3' [Kitasatospora paranensis]|uniref:CRISPR-associated helicase Cas3 n=1 Tax=Kitasatospora paranensis TaxID=258053 RepID=A0ABW2FRG0_9ACTN
MTEETEASRSVAVDPAMAQLDTRLWGKRAGLPGPYPVICHLLDTAAVAGALWDSVLSRGMRAQIANGIGVPEAEARRLITFWAGLHDVGKITPPFQAKVPEEFAALAADAAYSEQATPEQLRHEAATHWSLVEFLSQCGYPEGRVVRRSVGHQVAQLLGGHHGCFGEALQRKHLVNAAAYQPGLGRAAGWRKQRLLHASAVRRLTGAVGTPESILSGQSAVVAAGLVVVADWLASQTDVIEPRMPERGWAGSDADLEQHYERAVAMAPAWVREAGLGRATFPERTFGDQFPFTPNTLQADIAATLPGLATGAGLLLVTAPTGDGKTEAALHAASVMARASGAGGVYFALPTMATADAMYERVRRFADANAEGERALTLLHSMAWLSPAYVPAEDSDGVSPVLSDGHTGTEAGRWLRAARRGLLAPLANGTIDQALTGVLPVRYGFLRLFGLANKVLVVDEAHAYGPWMHSLLVRLLEWLGALGAPVVLLSATLAGRTATSLVDAYRRGAGFQDRSTVEPCYPGWLFVDAANGEVSRPRQVGSDRARTLRVESRRVTWDVREGPVDRPRQGSRRAALRVLLGPVAAEGGCVLVCCTTVEEAQRTFLDLQFALPDLAAREGGLRLLHSRFPAMERQRITAECEAAFGKPQGGASGTRPGSVLVATQIVEQSLDLDFDLVVSDLAPLAQLLQRAGRSKRHPRADRPAWTGDAAEPRLVVLEPVDGEGSVRAPRTWGDVYDAALLFRTSVLVEKLAGNGVAVPDDVQGLVDTVYADDFGAGLADAAQRELRSMDATRVASAVAESQLAEATTVRSPYDVQGDLSCLTDRGSGVMEELLTTRLGADSARAVCVYLRDGGPSLDEDGDIPLPGTALGGRLTSAEIAPIMRHTVPLPGRWLARRTEDNDVPADWRDRPMLADLAVLPMQLGGDGRWTCRLGDREIEISKNLGISADLPNLPHAPRTSH